MWKHQCPNRRRGFVPRRRGRFLREAIVVPRGVEHRPVADEEVEVMLFEPAGVRNTGNVEHETLTAPAKD